MIETFAITYPSLFFALAFLTGFACCLIFWAWEVFTDDTCERCCNDADDMPSPEHRANLMAAGGTIDMPRGGK